MKVVLIIALCISQTLGGPLFWTPVSVTAPVVVTNIKDFIMSILGVTAIPFMDSVAKKIFDGGYLYYRLRFTAKFGIPGNPDFECFVIVYHEPPTEENWLHYYECDKRIP